MSRNFGIVRTAEIAMGTTAGTMKTLLQILSPNNWGVVCMEWGLGFDLTTATNLNPAEVQLARQTTAGTMTAFTPNPLDSRISDVIQTTASTNATAEPTLGALLDSIEVDAHSGILVQYPPIKGELILPGATRLGLLAANGAATAFNVRCYLKFEE